MIEFAADVEKPLGKALKFTTGANHDVSVACAMALQVVHSGEHDFLTGAFGYFIGESLDK